MYVPPLPCWSYYFSSNSDTQSEKQLRMSIFRTRDQHHTDCDRDQDSEESSASLDRTCVRRCGRKLERSLLLQAQIDFRKHLGIHHHGFGIERSWARRA